MPFKTPTTKALIGQPVPHLQGDQLVKGDVKYVADLRIQGMLWGKSLRSPIPHGTILSIDTSRAEQLSGVRAIITGMDTLGLRVGRQVMDIPICAEDVVRYVGERVAAVAADTPDIAATAIDLIEVQYEPLPSADGIDEAIADNAPILHPNLNSYRGLPSLVDSPSNVHIKTSWAHGNVGEGFSAAKHVVEGWYDTARMHQAYMEPHACIVWMDDDQRIHVIANNKAPYRVRRDLALSLGVEPEQFVFHPNPIGGDFGGKAPIMDIPAAYFLAKKSNKPVRMAMTYSEELAAAGPRHGARIHMRSGLNERGEIVAHHAKVYFNGGAYAGNRQSSIGDLPASRGAVGPYRIQNTQIDVSYVYTNQVPGGFMRAPGGTQTIFAFESHIDAIARHLHVDPALYRLSNLVREGDTMPLGEVFSDVRAVQTLEAALKASNYHSPKSPLTGRGVAVAERTAGPGRTQIGVTLTSAGKVEVLTSIFEQGTGTYTAIRQIVAHLLDIKLGLVSVQAWNTDGAHFDTGVGASRSMRLATPAIHSAVAEVCQKIAAVASEFLGWPAAQVDVVGTDVTRSDNGDSYPWSRLIDRTGTPVSAVVINEESGHPSHTAFTAQVAEVAIDEETGLVRLIKFTSAQDTGTVINPMGHRGQIYGSIVQGIGQALMENLAIQNGRVSNSSFLDYKIPTTADLPEMIDILLPALGGTGPLKVKEIGEGPIGPVASAIVNAVEDAVGVRLRSIPLDAEAVLRALRGRV